MKILIIAGLIVFIIFVWALVLALCEAGADETTHSILYDDPKYFEHDEPRWLADDDKKTTMQQDARKEHENIRN